MSGLHLLSKASSDDELTARWQVKDPEHYAHIRTLAERAGLADDVIGKLQEGYARQFSLYGAFISRPDQVPGYRRVVKLDPGWQVARGVPVNVLLAVDHDGHLSGRVMEDIDGRHPSVMDMLEFGEPWGGRYGAPETLSDLSRFAKGYRHCPIGMAQAFKRGMQSGAMAGPLPKSFTGPVGGMILRRLQTSHRLAAWALLDALDPEMKRHMRAVHQVSVQSALWLSGNDMPAEPGQNRILARNRLQACRAYPLMSETFAGGELRDTIDQGLPLAPVLEKRLQLNRHELRYLQGLSWQKLGLGFRVDKSQICHAVKAAAATGSLSRDTTRNLWRIHNVARKFALSTDEVLQKIRPAVDAEGKIDWERISKLTDAADMVDYLADKLYVPAALIGLRDRLQNQPEHAGKPSDQTDVTWKHVSISPETLAVENHAFREAFMGMSLKDLLAASDRWHRSLPAHDSRIAQLRTGVTWRALQPSVPCENGVSGRELTSSDALTRQGQMEGHCVGGYDGSVVNSSEGRITLIYSIERGDEILGTLELCGHRKNGDDDRPQGFAFEISQLRGKRNGDVGDEVKAAAKQIRDALKALEPDEVASYLSGLAHSRNQRQGQAALMKDLAAAKYNFWDRKELEAAWSELSVYLPRAVRKAGLDALIESCGAELERNYSPSSVSTEHPTGPDGVVEIAGAHGMTHKVGVLPFWETQQAQAASLLEGTPAPEILSRYQLRGLLKEMGKLNADAEVAEKQDDDFNMDEVPF